MQSNSTCSGSKSRGSDSDDSMFGDLEFLDMLTTMCNMESDATLHNKGYKKSHKICDTLQGDLHKAQIIDIDEKNDGFVAIKRTDKILSAQGIGIEDGFTFCVSDNCIKEAVLLKQLTVDNAQSPFAQNIVQFKDFFESETDCFLITEYISSETNLQQFISRAAKHIQDGTLSMEVYQSTMRRVLCQMFATVQWLHGSMKCCHLNLSSKNILLQNAQFIETPKGMIIDPNITIKLHNFTVSEDFVASNDFLCRADPSYLYSNAYSAPKVFNDEIFDARYADNWCLGMILFECITVGQRLYEPLDVGVVGSGHWALHHGELQKYLKETKMFRNFDRDSFALLNGLLAVDEAQRLNGINILKMKWFQAN